MGEGETVARGSSLSDSLQKSQVLLLPFITVNMVESLADLLEILDNVSESVFVRVAGETLKKLGNALLIVALFLHFIQLYWLFEILSSRSVSNLQGDLGISRHVRNSVATHEVLGHPHPQETKLSTQRPID